jgi:AcrR family transcriptional regulator
VEDGHGPGTSSLADEKSEVTRARIRRAAMTVVAQRGFRATIDEIATTADVSARTVFRHYAGHDDLLADAITAMTNELGRPVDGLPDPSVDLHGWLWRLALTAQTRNVDIMGWAFWDFYNPPPGTSTVILEALAERRAQRGQWMAYIVGTAWKHAGGAGPAPQELEEAFNLLFSAYATHPLATDFGHSSEQAATLMTNILAAFLASTVAQQQG